MITLCGQILVSRKLAIRDDPNIRLRCSRNVKNTCFTDENTSSSPLCPLKHVSVCKLKNVPVYTGTTRTHVSTRVCVVPAYTGFQRVTHHTPHTPHTPQPTTTTTPHGDRHRERQKQGEKRRRKGRRQRRQDNRRENREDSFSVWWCMAVFC